MSPRQRVGLRAPREGDASLVPSTWRRRPLWRACDRRHAHPWRYATRTGNPDPGRFDLAAPRGTCYWALSAATAVIEQTSDPDQVDPPVLTVAALARLSVWQADEVPAARSKLADTTRASVPTLTAEIGTVVPYTLTWAWVDAFAEDGRNGLVYAERFGMDESVALFGPAGVPASGPAARRRSALDHYAELPPGFRAGVASVGDLDQLPRALAP